MPLVSVLTMKWPSGRLRIRTERSPSTCVSPRSAVPGGSSSPITRWPRPRMLLAVAVAADQDQGHQHPGHQVARGLPRPAAIAAGQRRADEDHQRHARDEDGKIRGSKPAIEPASARSSSARPAITSSSRAIHAPMLHLSAAEPRLPAPVGQLAHDTLPLALGHLRPARDLVERPAAARAQARGRSITQTWMQGVSMELSPVRTKNWRQ